MSVHMRFQSFSGKNLTVGDKGEITDNLSRAMDYETVENACARLASILSEDLTVFMKGEELFVCAGWLVDGEGNRLDDIVPEYDYHNDYEDPSPWDGPEECSCVCKDDPSTLIKADGNSYCGGCGGMR